MSVLDLCSAVHRRQKPVVFVLWAVAISGCTINVSSSGEPGASDPSTETIDTSDGGVIVPDPDPETTLQGSLPEGESSDVGFSLAQPGRHAVTLEASSAVVAATLTCAGQDFPMQPTEIGWTTGEVDLPAGDCMVTIKTAVGYSRTYAITLPGTATNIRAASLCSLEQPCRPGTDYPVIPKLCGRPHRTIYDWGAGVPAIFYLCDTNFLYSNLHRPYPDGSRHSLEELNAMAGALGKSILSLRRRDTAMSNEWNHLVFVDDLFVDYMHQPSDSTLCGFHDAPGLLTMVVDPKVYETRTESYGNLDCTKHHAPWEEGCGPVFIPQISCIRCRDNSVSLALGSCEIVDVTPTDTDCGTSPWDGTYNCEFLRDIPCPSGDRIMPTADPIFIDGYDVDADAWTSGTVEETLERIDSEGAFITFDFVGGIFDGYKGSVTIKGDGTATGFAPAACGNSQSHLVTASVPFECSKSGF